MTEDQRAKWRKALADKAKAQRRGRHRRKTSITLRAGMVRRQPPPKENT